MNSENNLPAKATEAEVQPQLGSRTPPCPLNHKERQERTVQRGHEGLLLLPRLLHLQSPKFQSMSRRKEQNPSVIRRGTKRRKQGPLQQRDTEVLLHQAPRSLQSHSKELVGASQDELLEGYKKGCPRWTPGLPLMLEAKKEADGGESGEPGW